MAKQVQVAIDCVDPVRLARFWADALDYQVEPLPPGAWAAVVDADGAGPRLHTIEDESDYFAVMRDPEGHEFCVC